MFASQTKGSWSIPSRLSLDLLDEAIEMPQIERFHFGPCPWCASEELQAGVDAWVRMKAIDSNLAAERFPAVLGVKVLKNRFQGFTLKRWFFRCISHSGLNESQRVRPGTFPVLCARRLIVLWRDWPFW